LNGEPTVSDDWIDRVANAQAPFQEPLVDAEGNVQEGYSFQFWLPADYDQEFMASGAFGQYLWIDKKREFVVAQFSTGQRINFEGESGASPREKEAVMRALGTFVIDAK
jgi:CubicO group peptidase (beta-lactamase class C family)